MQGELECPRWPAEEATKLEEMRAQLRDDLAAVPNKYPEVVGDTRLLRFLRGHGLDVPKAVGMYRKFLKFRVDYKVDAVRDDIVLNNLQTPFQFPEGAKIMELIPQIVCSLNALDAFGNPLAVELYGFDPVKVLASVTQAEYTTFVIYTLEFKALALTQEGARRERELLAAHKGKPPYDPNGYGVILQNCIIRDFNGFSVTAGTHSTTRCTRSHVRV